MSLVILALIVAAALAFVAGIVAVLVDPPEPKYRLDRDLDRGRADRW